MLLPLSLLLEVTPLPPTATPRPGGCATPGLSAEPGPLPSATQSPTLLLTKCATPAQFRSALLSLSSSPSRSLLRSAPRSPVRSALPTPSRSQGLLVLRSLSPLRPQWLTLLLPLLLPLLWPLLVTELALVLVLVPLLESLVLVLSATVPVLPLWLLLVLAMPTEIISSHNYY